MPLPLAVLAPVALRYGLRYGTVALATWTLARATRRGARDQKAEDAMDRTPEGMTARRENGQGNATARFRRILRRRADGPGIEIDIAALGRIRVRKV
jgi:hypothetical protein